MRTALLLLGFLTVPAPPQDDLMVAEGEHVLALCWFRSERAGERLAQELLDLGEAAWAVAAPWAGLPAGPPEEPFELIQLSAYPLRKQFVNAVEGIESGSSRGRVAWSHPGSRQVHVKLQPALGERELEDVGLPVHSLRLAAREVARLVLLEATGGEDRAPRWFVEGLTGWAAQQALARLGRVSEGGQDPAWSTALVLAQTAARAGRLPSVHDLLHDQPGDLSAPERQAVHAVLFDHLARTGWAELGPRITTGQDLADLLEGDALEGLEASFPRWLDAAQPVWIEDDPALARHGEGWVQTPLKGDNALAWRVAPPPGAAYTIRGEYQAYRDGDGIAQVNLALGRLGDDYISVSMTSPGGVHLWRFDGDKHARGEPAFEEVEHRQIDPPLPVRSWVPFEIHFADERLFLSVNGEDLLPPMAISGRPMDGRWGVGTLAGCVGLWRGLECVALE